MHFFKIFTLLPVLAFLNLMFPIVIDVGSVTKLIENLLFFSAHFDSFSAKDYEEYVRI